METDNGMNGGLWPYMLPAAASQIIPKVAGQGWHAYFRYSKPTPQQLRCAPFLLFGAFLLCVVSQKPVFAVVMFAVALPPLRWCSHCWRISCQGKSDD